MFVIGCLLGWCWGFMMAWVWFDYWSTHGERSSDDS